MNYFKSLLGKYPYFIAEIGINHNGDMDTAMKLIESAKFSGCDAVKFQKRTPEICVPKNQWQIVRDTPWGKMTYIKYKKKIEFNLSQYKKLKKYADQLNIDFIASCWDEEAVDFMKKIKIPFYKIASACITDIGLLKKLKKTKKPLIMSTGMSTESQIDSCVKILGEKNLCIMHCTSSYPSRTNELNLKYIKKLKKKYKKSIIGYSGHETNLSSTIAAVVLGAKIIERHITLDRSMWGTDQKSSIEPLGLARLIRDIKTVTDSMGNGIKKVYDTEKPMIEKLRLYK
jgi:N-acetylneuraminate synthase